MDASTSPQGVSLPELWAERKAKVWTTIADYDSPALSHHREEMEFALWQNGRPQLDAVVRDLRIRSTGWAPVAAEIKHLTRGSTIAPDGILRSVPTLIAWFPHYNRTPADIMGWALELAAVAS